MPTESGSVVSFAEVVVPGALTTPLTVTVALAVSRPSGRLETSTRIVNRPPLPMTPVPVTRPVLPAIVYRTVAPTGPLTTSGASVWSPFATFGAIVTSGAAGALICAPAAAGGSVFGELIGLIP